MLQNAVMEDISTAFEKLTIATETHDKDEDDSLFLIFQTYLLSSIDTLRIIKEKNDLI